MGKERRPSTEWNYADIKGDLVRLGASVRSDAKLMAYASPVTNKPVSFIMVDRVADMNRPPYQVWGFCTCLLCGEYCYLGSESVKLVADPDNDTYPICLPCGNLHIPRDKLGEPDDHVNDALSEES